MSRRPIPLPALAALVAAALGTGCGFGEGDSSEGDATLVVTRDYGTEAVLEATSPDPSESETVMRFLDREADIETRYGGGFVQSIEGTSAGTEGDRTLDWFFFVNGIESEIGAAEADVLGGDRVWWDYRDWTEAMRVPAVVGAWPEPFLQASAGAGRLPVRVVCGGEEAICNAAQDALADSGVSSVIVSIGDDEASDAMRMVVGPWAEIRDDPAARLLERPPAVSGVFTRVTSDGFATLDVESEEAGVSEGIVAATRVGGSPPSWIVTGITAQGLDDAVASLDADLLRDHYAVATAGGRSIPLPISGGTP